MKTSTSFPNLKLKMEESFEESLLDHNLNRNLDDNRDILEDDTKAQKDNDARFTVAKNVVFVGAKKPVVDEPVSQEHGPDADASTVIDGNIPAEFMTKVKAKSDEL